MSGDCCIFILFLRRSMDSFKFPGRSMDGFKFPGRSMDGFKFPGVVWAGA